MEKENLLSAKKEPGEKYEINNAVWIAAAILILRSYRADKIATRDDLYFKQAEIAKLAALYADGYVDRARCSFLRAGRTVQNQILIRFPVLPRLPLALFGSRIYIFFLFILLALAFIPPH